MEFEEFIAVGVVEGQDDVVVGICGAPKLDSGIFLGLSLIVFVFDEGSMIF